MKLAREFAILFLGCAACGEAASRTAAGTGVNLSVLDVPATAAFDPNESDDVPVPSDVTDGLAYLRAAQHVRLKGSPPLPVDVMNSNADGPAVMNNNVDREAAPIDDDADEDEAPPSEALAHESHDSQPLPVDMRSSKADHPAVVNFNVGRDAASVTDGEDEDEAPIQSEAPLEALPSESNNAESADRIDNVQVRHNRVAQHVRLVDSPPLPLDVMSSNADGPAVMNNNVDREAASVNDDADEDEAPPSEALVHASHDSQPLPVDMRSSTADHPAVVNFNIGRDAASVTAGEDEDEAPIQSEAPLEVLPSESNNAESVDRIDNVQIRHKRDAQHVRLVDSPPLPVDVMSSNAHHPAVLNSNVDRQAAEAPIEALPLESQEAGLTSIPLPQPQEPEAPEAQEASSAPEAPESLEAPEAPWNAELSSSDGDTTSSEQEDDGSASDGYAMMMYLKGRSASVAKDNQRMKDMLTQAAAWGKGMQSTVASLDAERKETEVLKGKLRGYRAAKETIAKELQAERSRETSSESKVKALEYVHEQLLAAQNENADLQHQLDSVTHVDEDLRVQLVASERGVQAAEKSQSAVATQTKSEDEWLEEEAKKLENIKVVKKEDDAKLKVAQTSEQAAGKLQKVVDDRDKLLRKGLQQLLTEKENESELMRQLGSEEANFTGQLAAEKANATTSLQKLLASKAKVKKLRQSAAMAWRVVAQGDKARQEEDHNMTQAEAQLKQVKKGDEEVQAHAFILKRHIQVEKKALQNATESEQLADEARDAAQAELASEEATIYKLKRQDEAVGQENLELRSSLGETKRAESQLLREAMGSVADAGGLNLANLAAPVTREKAALVAVDAESLPADLPTLDVLPP